MTNCKDIKRDNDIKRDTDIKRDKPDLVSLEIILVVTEPELRASGVCDTETWEEAMEVMFFPKPASPSLLLCAQSNLSRTHDNQSLSAASVWLS